MASYSTFHDLPHRPVRQPIPRCDVPPPPLHHLPSTLVDTRRRQQRQRTRMRASSISSDSTTTTSTIIPILPTTLSELESFPPFKDNSSFWSRNVYRFMSHVARLVRSGKALMWRATSEADSTPSSDSALSPPPSPSYSTARSRSEEYWGVKRWDDLHLPIDDEDYYGFRIRPPTPRLGAQADSSLPDVPPLVL